MKSVAKEFADLVPPEVFRTLWHSYATPEDLYDLLVEVLAIREEFETIKGELAFAADEYEREKKRAEARLVDLEARCPHVVTSVRLPKHYASGGTENSVWCQACGKEL